MFIENLCILVLRTNVALALEGLKDMYILKIRCSTCELHYSHTNNGKGRNQYSLELCVFRHIAQLRQIRKAFFVYADHTGSIYKDTK